MKTEAIVSKISKIVDKLLNFQNIIFSSSCPFYPEKLRVLWEITHRCNLKCIHCFVRRYRMQELEKNSMLQVIDSLSKAGVKELWISGGEPTLVKDLPFIIKYATTRGFSVTLSSNLSLPLNKRYIRKLSDAGVKFIHSSLDGLGEIHDRVRGVKIFHILDKNLSLIINSGITVGVSLVLSKYNMDINFVQYFNYIKTKGISRVSIYKAEQLGAAQNRNLGIGLKEELIILQNLYDALRSIDLSEIEIQLVRFTYNGPLRKCSAEKFYSLFPNGEVSLCPWLSKNMPIIVGNILHDDPEKIFDTAKTYTRKILKLFEEQRSIFCSKCPFRNECGGGCPALAFHTNFKSDPLCITR